MSERQAERDRCLAIVQSHMDGSPIEARRVLTRVCNDITDTEADSSQRLPPLSALINRDEAIAVVIHERDLNADDPLVCSLLQRIINRIGDLPTIDPDDESGSDPE